MIGGFGLSFMGRNIRVVMIVTSIIAGVSMVLFITALTARTDQGDIIQNVSWTYAKYESGSTTYQVYYGLSGIFEVVSLSGVTSSTYISYDSDVCDFSTCSTCNKAATSEFGLTLSCFCFTLAVIILSLLRLRYDHAGVKISAVAGSFLTLLLSCSAFGNWRQTCYNSVNDNYSSYGYTINNGPAFNIEVAGFFFMILVFILHLITPVVISVKEGLSASALSKA
jgi:hypothetical protein